MQSFSTPFFHQPSKHEADENDDEFDKNTVDYRRQFHWLPPFIKNESRSLVGNLSNRGSYTLLVCTRVESQMPKQQKGL